MPNHIISEVEIKGTKEQIAKLIKDTKIVLDPDTDKNFFDFNAIVEMPPELSDTTCPTKIVETEEEAKRLNEEEHEVAKKNGWFGKSSSYISKAEEARRLKEYGAVNWYDWSNLHWGTKWNAYGVRYIAHNDTTLVIKIETAWDTPRDIWNALREQGFEVNGFMHGEMDGYDEIGDNAYGSFDAYQEVTIEYHGVAIR